MCEQLEGLEEIVDPRLNPSGKFDAIGFSQGASFPVRALLPSVEWYGIKLIRSIL